MRRIKVFTFGFFLSAAMFVGANIYSYHTVVPPCCDFYGSFGFPLPLGEYGGFAGNTVIDHTELIKDALIGLGISLVFAYLLSKSFPLLIKSWLILSSSLTATVTGLKKWHMRTRL